jgi:hypothetical protein
VTTSISSKRNRQVVVLIFLLCLVPFSIAWYLAKNPQWIQDRDKTNYGHLIHPPVPLDYADLLAIPLSAAEHMPEAKGHWVMLQVASTHVCGRPCRDTAFKTGQLRLLLNKELTRVRRLLLVPGPADVSSLRELMEADPTLLIAELSEPMERKLREALGRPPTEGSVLLLDPFANLMMWYEPGFDPYGALRDQRKLLRVSQIG